MEVLLKTGGGITVIGPKEVTKQCDLCIQPKEARLPHNTIRNRAESPLQIIHTDVCNRSYDYTHFTKIYLMRQKSEVKDCMKNYVEETERKIITTIRCDNRGEYTGNEFRKLCTKKGTKLDLTVIYTAQLNEKAVRLTRFYLIGPERYYMIQNFRKRCGGSYVLCYIYIEQIT